MKPLDKLPAVPAQAAVIRMVTNLMTLQAGGLVNDAEYLTIRTRIAQWDFEADAHGMRSAAGGRMRKVG